MKYLKRFNESNDNDSVTIRLNKWVVENISYSKNDILYYFSEFTDEYEYEYNVEDSGNSILKNGYIDFSFIFTKTMRTEEIEENILDKYIQFGKEIESFKIHLNQFKNVEEDIKDVKEIIDVDFNTIRPGRFDTQFTKIIINFKKLIPDEILSKFRKELKEEENQRKSLGKDPSNNYGITRRDIEDIISQIYPQDIFDELPPYRGDVDSISLDFDFDQIEINNLGDRIMRIIPIISIDGEINDGMTERLSDILYNFDTEEFI